MAPHTVDFVRADEATAWRRSQLGELLAALKAGERVVLKVLGWGEIRGQFDAYEGDALTLTSGRRIAVDDVLDVHPAVRRIRVG